MSLCSVSLFCCYREEKPDRPLTNYGICPHSSNIPLSATTDSIDASAGRTVVSYVPPHPEKGTRYHRYTYLLFEQSQAVPEKATMPEEQITDFDVRSFADEHGLSPAGVTFFRQVWDQDVPKIYEQVLSESVLSSMHRMMRVTEADCIDFAYLSLILSCASSTRAARPFCRATGGRIRQTSQGGQISAI